MGIRFDRDTKRATNGPLIFFSDPSAESDLANEIRGAIEANLSFYAYRRPGDLMVSFGSSEGVLEGIGEPGFVIAPFNPDLPYLTIPYKKTNKKNLAEFSYHFPEESTKKEDYFKEIEEIKSKISEGEKIVAARAIINSGRIDVGATFGRLSMLYPDAFVFCFGTPQSGVWIGASPELLLESSNAGIKTMALAGTRKSGDTSDWDSKNMEEQQTVTNFISREFLSHEIQPKISQPFTKVAGNVEHICTEITGSPQLPLTDYSLSHLLHDLSPTPALCGFPKDLALKVIDENENFKRGFYGGFCGPFHSTSDFTFNVVLRCALVEMERFSLFAGGGITLKSEPEKEWEETEAKADTIRKALSYL